MAVVFFGGSPHPLVWQQCYSLPQRTWKNTGANTATIMDDNMLCEPSPLLALDSLEAIVDVHIRYMVPLSQKNPEDLVPKLLQLFGGVLYHTPSLVKWYPLRKLNSIAWHAKAMISAYRAGQNVTATRWACLTGQINAASVATLGTRVHTDQLQRALKDHLSGGLNYSVRKLVPAYAIPQLEFFRDLLPTLNGRMIISGRKTNHAITTDFSGHGMGAIMDPEPDIPNPPEMSVPLPPSWREVWSGYGETLTAIYALMSFAIMYGWQHCIILMRLDNIAAICYLNQMGSSCGRINAELLKLLLFCRRHNIMIIATYVPGAIIIADEPSRRLATTWTFPLAQWVYSLIVRLLCPSNPPTFDLFASFMTAKTVEFASLQPDPRAVWVDCLKQPWALHNRKMWYAFPPPNQLSRVLNKTLEERQTLLLVAPAWPHLHTQKIADLLLLPPILFPFNQQTVPDPHPELRSQKQVLVRERWIMAGYLVSGDTSKVTLCRRNLKNSMHDASALTQAQLDGCQWSGQQTAKALEWIQRLAAML